MNEATANKPPRHVAIIMDGNGRWAKQRGLPRIEGHRAGADSVRAVVRACRESGVQYLTLFAFSTENWVRPQDEVNGLMTLLLTFLRSRERELHENEVRLRTIGDLSALPGAVRRELDRVIESTRPHGRGQLILALNYGGRAELVRAARGIAREARAGVLDPEAITEASISGHLDLPDVPDPDLLIRTSGEQRLSNFLLWQLSYAEFLFTPVLWPDFREKEFHGALAEFERRKRRFGDVK